MFKENEVGCLAGDLAARVAAANITPSKAGASGPTIGWVGGIPVPAVIRYGAGYTFCAKKAVPGITVLKDFSQDFVAQDKCKELALKHFDAGSSVEFQVAGGCGLGVLDAAKEQGKWGIGVDVDQRLTAPKNILTSAEKKVDVGVYDTIAAAVKGTFKGGTDRLFTLKDGGVGLAPISSKVPAGDQGSGEEDGSGDPRRQAQAAGEVTDRFEVRDGGGPSARPRSFWRPT